MRPTVSSNLKTIGTSSGVDWDQRGAPLKAMRGLSYLTQMKKEEKNLPPFHKCGTIFITTINGLINLFPQSQYSPVVWCPFTCLWVALVLTWVQEAASTQLTEPGSAGVLLVVEQDLSWVQPVRGIQLAAMEQDEPGSWGKNGSTWSSGRVRSLTKQQPHKCRLRGMRSNFALLISSCYGCSE